VQKKKKKGRKIGWPRWCEGDGKERRSGLLLWIYGGSAGSWNEMGFVKHKSVWEDFHSFMSWLNVR